MQFCEQILEFSDEIFGCMNQTHFSVLINVFVTQSFRVKKTAAQSGKWEQSYLNQAPIKVER